MSARAALLPFVLLGLAAPASGALAANCTLEKVAHLPVTMTGLRPLVHASINGHDALFIADSGAFFNMISPAAADEFKLPLRMTWVDIRGVGGESSRTSLTTVKTFTLFNLPLPDVEFFVAGNDFGEGAVGLLGQNVFRIAGDVEYDLANGVINLMRPKDCGDRPLAYWATSIPYSVIDIERATREYPHTRGVAFVNGVKIRVMFDTGAATSVVSLAAAKRAGVTPDGAGVIAAGHSTGVGRRSVMTWIAPFPSFKIGDEEIRNTHLRFGAIDLADTDMLVGADFFLSHRVYVANSQHKLYFTYNGGPVFNLTTSAPPRSGPAPNDSAGTNAAASGGAATESAPATDLPGQPTDAAGFSRRGAAFASRRDFEHAIADLTRACALDPNEANYFYQRGRAYWGNNQADLAMSDFDQALKLKPDDLSVLVARAELHLQRNETPAAIADLNAANKSAAKEDGVHRQLGSLYLRTGQLAASVAQYTLWIDSHPRADVNTPQVLGLRCWSRGLWGQELDSALSDCDKALGPTSEPALVLRSRAMVRLRRGEYDKAIADCDQAVSLRPKDAWTHYIRGIAKIRKGMTADGQADLAAATALNPAIAEQAAQLGLTP